MSSPRIDRRARLRRRRRARLRGLIALAVIVALMVVGGVALARALTGGGGEAPAAARDGSGVVLVAIDNLCKVMASQAVQNMNLALGLAETEGLRVAGRYPA